MDHATIAALAFAERGTEKLAPREERRREALTVRARRDAARRRAALWTGLRGAVAGALRRAAEAIEPPRTCGAIAERA